MAFLVVWLLGDVSNLSRRAAARPCAPSRLRRPVPDSRPTTQRRDAFCDRPETNRTPFAGALFTKLAPSAVALATYFCFLDAILIAQTGYYKGKAARRRAAAHQAAQDRAYLSATASEDSPLLGRRRRSSTDLPGSLIRHDTHRESALEPIRKVVTGQDETPERRPWLNNLLGLMAIYIVGFAGWFVTYKAGIWSGDNGVPDSSLQDPSSEDDLKAKFGLALGYVSALFYLCARLPQIFKNYQEKSCEGLSLLFFMLSLTGNLTYGLGLISYSQNKEYLLNTLPWLLGSLGTMVEDSTIFVQFRIYGDNARGPSLA
ncbi:vacuolar membrane PQ loop repeat protein [Metarhizium album ARSEF 1941]|uniref:Vacuolar membrane PQ loop repeat protein n=1 Tax=Metarhizium album (strain ARSEF 1941) TaxID=1081103 RepID=A0A0B2WXS7_METAS|nr:vacuolar membrane PQ loop repeat protein [Metarhizium album ARSEF 1941]KHN98833.1 vacuolar membrane PQ loop repeat protein [Metarhizium album ARSEF 1941]